MPNKLEIEREQRARHAEELAAVRARQQMADQDRRRRSIEIAPKVGELISKVLDDELAGENADLRGDYRTLARIVAMALGAVSAVPVSTLLPQVLVEAQASFEARHLGSGS